MTTHRKFADALLRETRATEYRPSILSSSALSYSLHGKPFFTYFYAEWMRDDPQVDFCLRVLKGPLCGVEWEVETASPWAKKFIGDTLEHIWTEYSQKIFDTNFVYGFAPGQCVFSDERGAIRFSEYIDFYPPDAVALLHVEGKLKNKLAGLRIRPLSEDIYFPQAFWFAPDARFQRHYGRPTLKGAFEPFLEKSGKSGATDSRRLWFKKAAFRGVGVRYPAGETNVGTADVPRVISNYALARQIVEIIESGSNYTLPNTFDANGKPLWEIIDGASFPDNAKIIEYPGECDKMISKGMGIPPEVYEASTTGSGYSGRAIPLTVFLSTLDVMVDSFFTTLKRQVLRKLVFANAGKDVPFVVRPKRLIDQLMKEDASKGTTAATGGAIPTQPPAMARPENNPSPGGDDMGNDGANEDDGSVIDRNTRVRMSLATVRGFLTRTEPVRKLQLSRSANEDKQAPGDGESGSYKALAELLANQWNLYALTGAEPTQAELDDADDELAGGPWSIIREHGQWAVDAADEDKPGRVQLSVKKAPSGGVKIGGKNYKGGMFIPGDQYDKADAATKEAIDHPAAEKKAARLSRGDVDHEALKAKLAAHLDHPMDAHQVKRAASAYQALKRHHDDATVHRIEELVNGLHAQYEKLDPEQPGLQGIRDEYSRQLAGYNVMLSHAKADGYTGKVGSEGTPAAVAPAVVPAPVTAPTPAAPPTPPTHRDDGTPIDPATKHVYTVKPGSLKTDASRFQYKVSGIKSDGVTDELKGTNTWNPELGGTLLVWRDPANGQDYVVNGHHRHELAHRTNAEDINVRYIDAPNAKEARARGALANIAEGRGTATDAAKYLRDSGHDVDHLQKAGISLSGKVASDASQLKDLSDKAFDGLTQERITEPTAVAVAKHLKDHALQDLLFKKLDARAEDGKDWSGKEIETAAKKMARAGSTTEKGTDLFGEFENEKSTFDQEVELESHIAKALNQKVNDYAAVANEKRADRVKDAGNTLAVDENARRRDAAAAHAEAFERESALKSPVADAIKAGAAELAVAKTKTEKANVKQRTFDAVHAILAGGGAGTTGSAGTTHAPAAGTGEAAQPVAPLAGGSGTGGTGAPGNEPGRADAGADPDAPVVVIPAKPGAAGEAIPPMPDGFLDKPKIEYVRAPVGGKVSDVDGKHYKGGQLMPIHGIYSGMEKSPKSENPIVPSPETEEQRKEKEAKRRERTPPSPLTPEQIEERRQRHEEQKKWDEINRSPLGPMKWLGEKPNSKALTDHGTRYKEWKEYAEKAGPKGMQSIIDQLEPELHQAVDTSKDVPEEHREWYKKNLKDRAAEDATMHGGKTHEKKSPGSHYARVLLGEMMDRQNHNRDPIDNLKRLGEILAKASGQ